MAQCPWLTKGCCRRAGMHMVNCLTDPAICLGKQRNGQRYTDCKYYTNPKQFASGNLRPCPHCNRTDDGNRFYAVCYSTRHPANANGGGIKIREDSQLALCIGRTVKGKKYTSCPYYYKGKGTTEGKETTEVKEARKKETKKQETTSNWSKIIKWMLILLFVLYVLRNMPW